jgi:hypothetical protein
MGRFANSWSLAKTSFGIVRQDKELLVLPILSFLASIIAFLLVTGLGFGAGILPNVVDPATGYPSIGAILLAFVTYLALAFVQVFFAAAVVAGASERLAGGDPTLGSCIRKAWRHVGRLLAWSAVVATVNVILQMVREHGGRLGQMVAGIGNMAWNLVTYFMTPILLFEDKPIAPAVRRSGSLFKQTWGETVIGTGGVGLVFGIIGIVVMVLGFLAAQMAYAAAGLMGALPVILLVVASLVLLATLQSVLGGVYKAALYRFATTGQAGAGFTQEQLGHAFVQR